MENWITYMFILFIFFTKVNIRVFTIFQFLEIKLDLFNRRIVIILDEKEKNSSNLETKEKVLVILY